MHKLFALVLAIVLGALGALSQAGTADARPQVSVTFHCTWSSYSDGERAVVLDKLAAAGVEWVRIDVGWNSIQPDRRYALSSWHVNLVERCVDMARARGIKVMITLSQTPAWANGGQGITVPPASVWDFGEIAHWLGAYFRGRVGAWEIWNEPNLPGSYWAGNVWQYVALVQAAYPGFKAGDPNALVAAGSIATNDDGYLRQLYSAGIRGYFDVLSTHPYQSPGDLEPEAPDTDGRYRLSHTGAMYAVMAANGDGGKPIWITEFGWSSHSNYPDTPRYWYGVSEDQQGDFAVRSIRYIEANFPYVTNWFWYSERNKTTGHYVEDNYGLLRQDLSEKPAYWRLRGYLRG